MVEKKIFSLVLLLILFISFASALTIEEINLESSPENITPIFFYGSGCPHCAKASTFLESFELKYDFLEIKRLEINQNIDLINQLYLNYGVSVEEQSHVPILFIGEKYYLGDSPIIQNFETTMLNCSETGCELIAQGDEQEFSLITIVSLAAVDAVNPCELAVLIILMTAILSRFPKQKKKALKAGLLFSLAIFLMYIVFGFLIIGGFKALAGITSFSGLWFFTLLGVIAIVMGLLNLKDAIWYGGGGFIMEVPQKWRPKMKSIIEGTASPKGAFVVGLIVSFFLTPCTAGPYFVAGGILSTVSWLVAASYLLVYMGIFISPMVLITLLTYFGFAKVEDMSGWRERNLKKLHWIAGLLMLGIGVLMILWGFGIL